MGAQITQGKIDRCLRCWSAFGLTGTLNPANSRIPKNRGMTRS